MEIIYGVVVAGVLGALLWGARVTIQSLRKDRVTLLNRIDRLEAELSYNLVEFGEAGTQFRFYEKQHLAKTPPDVDKARANTQWAERCERHAESIVKVMQDG